MSIGEARSRISSIVGAVGSYQSSISSLQGILNNLSNEVSGVTRSIPSDVNIDAIVSYSENTTNKIIASIQESLELSKSALSTLKNDANRKIKEIVDSYNNSIDPKKGGETLSYYTIN